MMRKPAEANAGGDTGSNRSRAEDKRVQLPDIKVEHDHAAAEALHTAQAHKNLVHTDLASTKHAMDTISHTAGTQMHAALHKAQSQPIGQKADTEHQAHMRLHDKHTADAHGAAKTAQHHVHHAAHGHDHGHAEAGGGNPSAHDGVDGIQFKKISDWSKHMPPHLKDQDGRESKRIEKLVKAKVEKERHESARQLANLKNAQLKAAAGVAGMKGGLQATIAGAQRAAVGKIAAAEAAQAASVQAHVAGVQASVQGQAGAMKAAVNAAHAKVVAKINADAQTATQQLQQQYNATVEALSTGEAAQHTVVQAKFTEIDTRVTALGSSKASEASGLGNMSLPYSGDQLDAAKKAAQQVAEKYSAAMPDQASKAVSQINQNQGKCQDAVTQISQKCAEEAQKNLDKTTKAIEQTKQEAIKSADKAKQQSIEQIDKTAESTVASLGAFGAQQVTGIHAQGSAAKAGVEKSGAAAIAGVGQGCDKAADGIRKGAEGLAKGAKEAEVADPHETKKVVAKASADLKQSVASISNGLHKNASQAAGGMSSAANSTAEGMAQAASAANAQASQMGEQANQSLAKIAEGAKQALEEAGQAATKQLHTMVESGQKGFKEIEKGQTKAYTDQTTKLGEGLDKTYTDVSNNFNQAVPDKEREVILSEAAKAAAKVPKHWWQKALAFVVKIVVAIVITVAVIAIAGVTGGVGLILVGALAGALATVGSTMAGNLIEGNGLFDGITVQSVLLGAVGGAISGGLTGAVTGGALGSTIARTVAFEAGGMEGLAAVGTRFGVNFVIGEISDVGAQLIVTQKYEFSMEGLIGNVVSSGLSSSKSFDTFQKAAADNIRTSVGLEPVHVDTNTSGAGGGNDGGGGGGGGSRETQGAGGGGRDTQNAGGNAQGNQTAKGGNEPAGKTGGGHETPGANENTGHPGANENKPGANENKPGANENKPGANDNQNHPTENKTGGNENKPGANDNKPGANEHKPGANDNKPGANEHKPGTNENKPGANDNQNHPTENKTGGNDNKPGANEHKPGTNENKPGTNENKPGTNEHKPGANENKPGANDNQNHPTENKTGGNEHKPGANDNKPGANEGKGGKTEHNHESTPAEDRVAEIEQALDEVGYKNATPEEKAAAEAKLRSGEKPSKENLRDTEANQRGVKELEKVEGQLSPEEKADFNKKLADKLANEPEGTGNLERDIKETRAEQKAEKKARDGASESDKTGTDAHDGSTGGKEPPGDGPSKKTGGSEGPEGSESGSGKGKGKGKTKTRGVAEEQLSEKGMNDPVPLEPHERAAIEKYQAERNKYLERWRDPDTSMPKETQDLLWGKGDRAIRKNMTPDDLAAVVKEGRGVEIPKEDGTPFNHGEEYRGARNAAKNQMEKIKARLEALEKSGTAKPGEIEALQQKLGDMSRLLDHYERVGGMPSTDAPSTPEGGKGTTNEGGKGTTDEGGKDSTGDKDSTGGKGSTGDKAHDGISGGKTSLEDFAGGPIGDEAKAQAHEASQKDNAGSLADQADSIKTGKARSEEEMLAAIAQGDTPRYVARVDGEATFAKYKSFGRGDREFVYATEPADLRGLSPAKALEKVGWTKEWIQKLVGQEIAICVLDTKAVVKGPTGEHATSVGKMEWPELTAKATNDPKFVDQAMNEAGVTSKAELEQIFDILKNTPVHAEPHTTDPSLAAKAKAVRKMINDHYSANDLYTGMGATMNTSGELGAREVMVNNNDTKFQLTPDNHVIVKIGKLTQADVDALK